MPSKLTIQRSLALSTILILSLLTITACTKGAAAETDPEDENLLQHNTFISRLAGE